MEIFAIFRLLLLTVFISLWRDNREIIPTGSPLLAVFRKKQENLGYILLDSVVQLVGQSPNTLYDVSSRTQLLTPAVNNYMRNRVGCHVVRQEVGRCSTRGESQGK